MADPDSSDNGRLEELRRRWQQDPSSRVFLQLAEEHRRRGQTGQALQVLEEGLRHAPTYLSAKVALGRCRLELGDAVGAAGALESVLAEDATHLVANKLLVEAYLQSGQADQAARRLDTYYLLNDSDPEIAVLKERIAALQDAEPAPTATETLRAMEEGAAQEDAEGLGGLDDTAESAVVPPDGSESEASKEASADASDAPESGDASDSSDASESGDASDAADAGEVQVRPGPADDDGTIFGGSLTDRDDSRRRYRMAFSEEGLFPVAEEESEIDAELAAVVEDAPEDEAPAREAVFEVVADEEEADEPEAAGDAPQLGIDDTDVLELVPDRELGLASPVGDVPDGGPRDLGSTSTLGDLYYGQGHYSKAAEIYRRVLEQEPGNTAAAEGLERALAAQGAEGPAAPRYRLTAGDFLTGSEDEISDAAEAGLTARKIHLFKAYLGRVKPETRADSSTEA